MSATETDTAAANEALVRKFMEVFSSGDVDATMDMMTDDSSWWVAGTMEGLSGTHPKEDFRALLSGVAENVKGGAIKLTPLAFTVQGERVAIETESYAELNNGRVYNNLYHFLMTVRDGKISGVKEFLDTQHTYAILIAP